MRVERVPLNSFDMLRMSGTRSPMLFAPGQERKQQLAHLLGGGVELLHLAIVPGRNGWHMAWALIDYLRPGMLGLLAQVVPGEP